MLKRTLRRGPPTHGFRMGVLPRWARRNRLIPDTGFSSLIRRIRLRISIATLGRPPRERDFQRH